MGVITRITFGCLKIESVKLAIAIQYQTLVGNFHCLFPSDIYTLSCSKSNQSHNLNVSVDGFS